MQERLPGHIIQEYFYYFALENFNHGQLHFCHRFKIETLKLLIICSTCYQRLQCSIGYLWPDFLCLIPMNVSPVGQCCCGFFYGHVSGRIVTARLARKDYCHCALMNESVTFHFWTKVDSANESSPHPSMTHDFG